MTERLTAVRRALAEAPAELVVECLAGALAKEYSINDVELLLVDYRLAALLPLTGGPGVTRPGDPAWRTFDHQEETTAGHLGYLPVTVRGERLGVLRVHPLPSAPDQRAELAEVATLLAHELQTASAGTDRYTIAARAQRLTLAAELQWELLPGRSRSGAGFSLAGQLEPAYAVRGDSFDWAERDGKLFVSVLNGMGDGMPAALLTSLATQAVRNARRAGLPLADQAGLADQAIFSQHRGAAHVAALLLELDLETGEVSAVDTGSPRLLVLRDGAVADEHLDAQFPLGMFESSEYTTQTFALRPGDRLVIVSDGIFAAPGPTGAYGDAALHRFVRHTVSLAPLQAVRSLLGDLRAFVAGDLEDDAVIVCVDWIP
ncbi:PP2C family protein-serine/threonine phosphatase [Actinoplanes sp. N902-109]|uniref:PP2C family protein-serine/threonine phosphatase n=1 Tax=Actinoplanes sp. (strain N902-109) TaxID=649831 RepID=UPI00032959FB|nr:PP2C family protein-serine/threonine phosphatase [Actinoplanes sp. N902-109]AGL14887.1 magnesium or manganese-dependent protein phosphatase [Actinoplanes sp. N902-109]